MAPTTTGLRHAGVRPAAAPFVTLGPRQFTVLAVSLLLYGLLYAILLAPFIARHFARTDVQAHERAFGFRLGLIDEGQIRDWHIVGIRPEGRMAAAGFEPGDVPIEHHGNGLRDLAFALDEAAAGRTACVMMWNDRARQRRQVCLSP